MPTKQTNPIETVRQFLQEYCADADGTSELVNHLELQALVNARPLLQAMKDIESLLSQSFSDDTLLHLVTQDARIKLDRPTGEAARNWLTWLAEQIRKEINENLLPFQPIRAKLLRSVEPADERLPHDLTLYPTDDPQPEYWNDIWVKGMIFYDAFMKEWDGTTCPACKTPTIKRRREKKFSHEITVSIYNSTVYYNVLAVYKCSSCNLGWTERTGSEHFTEVEYP